MNLRRIALLSLVLACGSGTSAFGQAEAPPTPAPANGSRLELPKGATAAIVVFEDLQCPDCKAMHPQLLAAAKVNTVPLVIHDFPIQRHAWAFPAAVLARYFTAQSSELGLLFRSAVFEYQADINSDNLREFAEQFAAAHQVVLPPVVDPDGKLKDGVQADYDFGIAIGLQYVPLVFVIGPGQGAAHWVEVTDPKNIPDAIAKLRSAAPHR
ncbi:MAG TPA: thioredoxin domain-containing protein [Steroidobacteraceae bacterium]|nr:thioredoxin domain-containing protein [Steroidobacteraceae bacterium]